MIYRSRQRDRYKQVPAPLLIALIGLALLAVLVPVAVHQRRSVATGTGPNPVAATTQMPATARELPMSYTTAPRAQPTSVARIAVGVFLGMWMFAISAALIGGLIMLATFKSLAGR